MLAPEAQVDGTRHASRAPKTVTLAPIQALCAAPAATSGTVLPPVQHRPGHGMVGTTDLDEALLNSGPRRWNGDASLSLLAPDSKKESKESNAIPVAHRVPGKLRLRDGLPVVVPPHRVGGGLAAPAHAALAAHIDNARSGVHAPPQMHSISRMLQQAKHVEGADDVSMQEARLVQVASIVNMSPADLCALLERSQRSAWVWACEYSERMMLRHAAAAASDASVKPADVARMARTLDHLSAWLQVVVEDATRDSPAAPPSMTTSDKPAPSRLVASRPLDTSAAVTVLPSLASPTATEPDRPATTFRRYRQRHATLEAQLRGEQRGLSGAVGERGGPAVPLEGPGGGTTIPPLLRTPARLASATRSDSVTSGQRARQDAARELQMLEVESF